MFAQFDGQASMLLTETLLYAVMTSLVLRHSKSRHAPKTSPPARQRLLRAKSFIDEQPALDIGLTELAALAGMSPYHFVRQYKQSFGLAPHAYQIQARLKRAKSLLGLGQKPARVAVDCGFHDQSHLSRHFKRALGIAPGHFRKKSNFLQ